MDSSPAKRRSERTSASQDSRPLRHNPRSSFAHRLPTPPAQDKLMARMRAMVVRHQKRLHRRWGVRSTRYQVLDMSLTNLDSSPIHYASSSSPGRARNAQSNIPGSSSSALFVRGSATDEATSTQTSLARALPIADAGYLSMKMACLYRNLQTHQPSPTSTRILQTRKSWAGTPLESFGEPTYRS